MRARNRAFVRFSTWRLFVKAVELYTAAAAGAASLDEDIFTFFVLVDYLSSAFLNF